MAYAPSFWRNRDVLQQDLARGSVDATPPALSDKFAVDLTLSRLRRDKAAVIRSSFGIAALTVVHVAASYDQHDINPPYQHDGKDLPDKIVEWQHLEELRDEALEECSKQCDNNGAATSATIITSTTTTKSSTFPHKESAKATTASASAVMDSRAAVSRAVLCAAASIAVEALTPGFENDDSKLDPLDIPQNSERDKTVNMGSVILQAQTFGQRAIDQGVNSARRSTQRLAYQQSLTPMQKFLRVSNPFRFKPKVASDIVAVPTIPYNPNPESLTTAWEDACLPRFLKVLEKGTGHAVYCDMDWSHRHGRIANLLQTMAESFDHYNGPHLIITTQPNVDLYGQEFESFEPGYSQSKSAFRVLLHSGSKAHRSKLRQIHFGTSLGVAEWSYHIVVTSYQDFLSDYLDFTQQPWQVCLLDEGFAWLGAAQTDPNSQLAQLWDQGLFATADGHIGLATGTDWEFGADETPSAKDANIGLTCRHRIITTPSINLSQKQRSMTLPGLLACVLPHFTDVMKEEWDRSRITHDAPSLDHLKKLLTRSVIVHAADRASGASLQQLAVDSMDGFIPPPDDDELHECPPQRFISDEDFVAEGKISQSRRAALTWLSPWMRYELGMASFSKIVDAMKESTKHGHVCQEILPASVTTSSGASGAVIGSLAFRLGVRCGRSFGSEQGLRQHIAALHAPPGTWLCRTCGSDCGTSQARTHHERTCGQPEGADAANKETGAVFGPPGVVGKKAKGAKKASEPKDKDADGSFRVPGYRGVWVNPSGKHFVKISNEPLCDDNGDVVQFDDVDRAAKKHDSEIKKRGEDKGAELNFKKDGSRITYDDNAAASAAGRGVEMLGGGSSSVVPALSVINIKDLPKDVKPLLRDPRQTSRTGGNSKRHVYAYRGVCRQARKGHDRWQSQISFGGTNHYLGTFDSEWDAAAVYSWAHLILYGEEATKKAQREGEEAAAAYEREKAAIAAGEVLPPPPKPEKKKKPAKKRGKKTEDDNEDGGGETKKARKTPPKPTAKRAKPGPKTKGSTDVSPVQTFSQAVVKVPILAPRKAWESTSDRELAKMVSVRIMAARRSGYCTTDAEHPPYISPEFRPCISLNADQTTVGGAMLLGLNASLFGWMAETFAPTCDFESEDHEEQAISLLEDEYSHSGYNNSFQTLIQGSVCVVGRASKKTEEAWERLGLGPLAIGGTVGDIDCHIGGTHDSCSESAAIIQHLPTSDSKFQLLANNDEDIVTLNGRRISVGMGSFPLFNEDICTVGARVFVFLMPANA